MKIRNKFLIFKGGVTSALERALVDRHDLRRASHRARVRHRRTIAQRELGTRLQIGLLHADVTQLRRVLRSRQKRRNLRRRRLRELRVVQIPRHTERTRNVPFSPKLRTACRMRRAGTADSC